MHHQFSNQELARLSHAEAIRSSSRSHRVVNEVGLRESRKLSLLGRIRVSVSHAFARAPEPRTTS